MTEEELNKKLKIAFLQGAKYHCHKEFGFTMWQSEQIEIMQEADERVKNKTLGIIKGE